MFFGVVSMPTRGVPWVPSVTAAVANSAVSVDSGDAKVLAPMM